MAISYNFISLVAIGNFNPAIVSPYFLNEVCKLNLGESTDQSPPDIPVHKRLGFQNLRLTVDMSRLMIMEPEIPDITETKLVKIFKAYYEKLPYTPLTAVGVNINCDLLPKIDTEIDSLQKQLFSPQSYLKFFGSKKIDVTQRSLQTEIDKKWLSSNYRIENVRGLTRQITVTVKQDSIILNYNYEAGQLDNQGEKLPLLLEEYREFCQEFLRFLEFLEG